jgi:group I intron endonuclease
LRQVTVKQKSFKQQCQERGLYGKDYYRALKRRQAGHPIETVLDNQYIRHKAKVNPTEVDGKLYANFAEIGRAYKPVASMTTVIRKVKNEGWGWEAALSYIPNPGYATGIIYLITNRESNKQYVGQTIQTMERRWIGHCEDAFYRESNLPLHTAILNDGKDSFTIKEIDRGTALVDLCKKETFWITNLNTLSPYGYNTQKKGTSGGANGKPTNIDGLMFATKIAAAKYLSEEKGISLHAAKKRIDVNRLHIKALKAGINISKIHSRHYKKWDTIKGMCLRPNSKLYDASISLYEPWKDFFKFMGDIGPCPYPSWVFTRLNKSKGFAPDNCKWVTRSEASRLANQRS